MSGTLLLPLIVLAQTAAAVPATQPVDATLEAELRTAIAADRPAAAPAPAPTTAQPPSSQALMNPAISVIGTFAGSWRRRGTEPAFQAGDDPTPEGASAQELEIGFVSDLDPYFKMRAFLTIPNQGEVEVEEAYVLTTSLPWSALVKAGVFRSTFGRNGEQHLHLQDFARRPLATRLIGDDGLRATGGQASVLLPVPWFATLYGEIFTRPPGVATDEVSGVLALEQFVELGDSWSLLVGVNAATLAGPAEEEDDAGDGPPEAPEREFVAGGDVYLKWKPPNVTRTYAWAALTAEYYASRPRSSRDWDGAGYVQAIAQVARRWRIGARVDVDGLPVADEAQRVLALSGSLAFQPSEFSRLRLTYVREHHPSDRARSDDALVLQLEGAIGAHGAHPF